MNFMRNFDRRLLFAFSVLTIMAGLVWFSAHKNFPVIQTVLSNNIFGNIQLARPWIMYRELVVVFVDTRTFPADGLARRIARSWPVSASAVCCRFFLPERNQGVPPETWPWASLQNCRTDTGHAPR